MQFQKFIGSIVFLFFVSGFLYAQSIRQLEDNLENVFGTKKLEVLNELTDHYYSQNSKKALRYGRQAVSIGENLYYKNKKYSNDPAIINLVLAYNQLGKAYFRKGNYTDALDVFTRSERISNSKGFKSEWDMSIEYLTRLDSIAKIGEMDDNFFTRTLGNLELGEVINKTSEDIKINNEIRLGEKRAEDGKYQDAIEHYNRAIGLLRNQGETNKINSLRVRIAELYEKLKEYASARDVLNEAIEDNKNQVDSLNTLRNFEEEMDTSSYLTSPSMSVQFRDSLIQEKENIRRLMLEPSGLDKSQEYLDRYIELTNKIREDSIIQRSEQEKMDREILLLQQQKKIANLNLQASEVEKIRQVRFRNTSIGIAFLILIVTLFVLYLYYIKRRENSKLSIAYADLDKANSKLEEAEKRIVKLLNQHVSGDIAEELLRNEHKDEGSNAIARKFVCIMFVDIRDFTPLAETLSPEELINYQNKIFGFMIDVVNTQNGNINQLLGDGFMATFGAPFSRGNDCQNAFNAANQIIHELEQINKDGEIPHTNIGIGLHAGYVVAGNVGTEDRKQYSITGNTVIIASRIEQLNKKYKSQLLISEEVFTKLENSSQSPESLFEVSVKGRSQPIRIMKVL